MRINASAAVVLVHFFALPLATTKTKLIFSSPHEIVTKEFVPINFLIVLPRDVVEVAWYVFETAPAV